MADHYFAPNLEFAPSADPAWIRDAIHGWERSAVLGTNGEPLPPIPELASGLDEYRWGRFMVDASLQYRLRLEVVGARRRVRIGLLLSGPGLPGELTRGGGELVRSLTRNWRHRPQADSFPDRLREVRSSAEVSELVTRLLDPARKLPLVLVTRRSGTDELVADPERLLAYLAGMAEIWTATTTRATFELGEAFASRGYDSRWNCYDGGVRLYLPGLDPGADSLGNHPLILASRLQAATDPTEAAAAWALGAAVRALEVDRWREAWREQVADRRAPAEAQATLGDLVDLRRLVAPAEPAAVEPPPSPAAPSQTPEPEPERAPPAERASPAEPPVVTRAEPPLVAAPRPSPEPPPVPPKPDAKPSRFQRGLASLKDAFEVFVDLEQLLQEFQDELEAVRHERDTLARERDELSQELQDHDLARTRGYTLPTTLPDLLRMYAELGDGRLRVTDYACRKAARSRYADLRLVAQVLATLVAVGPGFGPIDAALKANLGKRVRARPKDSPPTMQAFGDARRFPTDDGEIVVGDQHLTLGHGTANLNDTLQIYWRRGNDGATELVYVGEHLPTVSVDT